MWCKNRFVPTVDCSYICAYSFIPFSNIGLPLGQNRDKDGMQSTDQLNTDCHGSRSQFRWSSRGLPNRPVKSCRNAGRRSKASLLPSAERVDNLCELLHFPSHPKACLWEKVTLREYESMDGIILHTKLLILVGPFDIIFNLIHWFSTWSSEGQVANAYFALKKKVFRNFEITIY